MTLWGDPGDKYVLKYVTGPKSWRGVSGRGRGGMRGPRSSRCVVVRQHKRWLKKVYAYEYR